MIDAAILGPRHHRVRQRSQSGLGRDGKSGGGEEARYVIRRKPTTNNKQRAQRPVAGVVTTGIGRQTILVTIKQVDTKQNAGSDLRRQRS